MLIAKKKLAVFKFASCDGCQLSLLDCEDELLALAGMVDIAYFPEATSATVEGPYDLSLVEGSVTTPHDLDRIFEVRAKSTFLVSIGACATAGGVQALRNGADVGALASMVYAHPEYLSTLAESTPIADHVTVDFELRGCPISKSQLLETALAFLAGRKPNIPTHALCLECKMAQVACVTVAGGVPCLGPVTQAGCGVICPSHNRGCFGCFGPQDTPNMPAMTAVLSRVGVSQTDICRLLKTFNAGAAPFAGEARRLEKGGRP